MRYKEETTDCFETKIHADFAVYGHFIKKRPRTVLRYQNTCGFCHIWSFYKEETTDCFEIPKYADFVIYGHFIKKRPRTVLRYQNIYFVIYGHFIKKRPRTVLRYQNTCGFCRIWSFYKEETTDCFEIPKYMRILSYMVIL